MKWQSLESYWGEIKDAYLIPKDEAQAVARTKCSSIYGEVSDQGVARFMGEIPLRYGKFADLGSGRGNVVAFVAQNYGFETCYGVEISKLRHDIATKCLAGVIDKFPKLEKVKLLNKDLFDFDLSKMDVVFCDNLIFEQSAIDRMTKKAVKEMKGGSFFVSMLSLVWDQGELEDSPLELVTRIKIKTSWSDSCPVFVYRISR